jgi:hypothetical protein
MAKARKYHHVKGHTRQGTRVPAHVRRMPKSCKKK